MFMVKYVLVFLAGLLMGWLFFSTIEEEEETVEPEQHIPSNKNPVFRAVAGARPAADRPSMDKELK